MAGVRVLDLSVALGGPFSTRMLGDLGAEVIKIEQPGIGDPSRRFGPYFLHGESAYYMGVNRNKKGMTLNLQKPEGRELFYELVRVSDVVFDSFRPSVLPKLGLEYSILQRINPAVIQCSLSGFGQEGPYRDRPAFDGIVQAMGGGMSVTGEPGRPPVFMGLAVGDLVGGYAAMVGITTALFEREHTGRGRRIDISLLDVQISLQGQLGQFYLVSGKVPGPIGSSQPFNIPVGAYRASDGDYIQIHCATQGFWENLAKVVAANVEGLEGLPLDPRFATPADRITHKDELDKILRAAFASKSREKWLKLLLGGDVPAGPINDIGQALSDPQVLLRNMVVEVDHSTTGRYKTIGNPIKMGQEEVFKPPPTLGQHTEEVLGQLLGYSLVSIRQLKETGVI